ncbi:VTT domain-containing protein [Mesobacillus foraminis]|uniref:TVP38/TMEM64 family protein n=1 Tax=Mesobacillus foraminis TaxID=279826 RepID=UPI0039A2388F
MKKYWANPGFVWFKERSIKVMLISIFLFGAMTLWNSNQNLFDLMVNGDIEQLLVLLEENLAYAYLVMFIVMVVQNSFTIIPLLLVISLNIGLFGFWNGFLWSWMTSVVAAVFIFISVKYLFQSKLTQRFHPELVERVEREGFAYVFRGRIFPFIPTSLVNILAGLSTITFRHFLLGTIYGNFLYFFVLSLIPAGLLSLEADQFVIGAIFIILFTFFYVFKKVYNKIRNDKKLTRTREEEEKCSKT